jgi:hypothetical protein
MLGDIALGGGLFTVVFVSPFVVTVLLLVDSVTIGSAASAEVIPNKIRVTIVISFRFLICISFLLKVRNP